MNSNKKVKGITKILAIMTSLIIGIAFMPVMAFATGYNLSSGYSVIFDDTDYSYTGDWIYPDFVVVDDEFFEDLEDWEETYDNAKNSSYRLDSGNYSYSYLNNKNVGEATLKITGQGSYSGSFSAYFYISSKIITITPTLNSDRSYTIETEIPGLQVTASGLYTYKDTKKYLQEGTDYTVDADGTITLTSDFTKGKTGFLFRELKHTIDFYSEPEGYVIEVKGVKSFNISKVWKYNNGPLTYSGKQKSVEVKIPGLTKGTDFTVSYAKSKRKAIGKYTYTVKGKGKYIGSYTYSFKIVPKKPKSVKYAKRTSSKAMVKWGKVYNCSGYQVQLVRTDYDDETDEPFYVVYKSSFVKGKSKLTKTFKNVKKSKYSKVRVRAYKTVNGTKFYSKWTYKKF